jgi:hypothetical protein
MIDARGYSYFSERDGPSVRRVYVGKASPLEVEIAARRTEAEARSRLRLARRRDRDRAEDEAFAELVGLVQLLAAAALLAGGCYSHKGQWRRRRAKRS